MRRLDPVLDAFLRHEVQPYDGAPLGIRSGGWFLCAHPPADGWPVRLGRSDAESEHAELVPGPGGVLPANIWDANHRRLEHRHDPLVHPLNERPDGIPSPVRFYVPVRGGRLPLAAGPVTYISLRHRAVKAAAYSHTGTSRVDEKQGRVLAPRLGIFTVSRHHRFPVISPRR